MLFSFVD